MANDLKNVSEQSRELWQKLPPRRRWVLVASVAGALLLGAFFAVRPVTDDYVVLTAGLPDEEAARIVEYLKAQAIPYRVDRGNAIEVPASRVHDARLGLALNDVAVGGGAGFELFDKQTFGTTSFGEQVNYLRALQGELERTIRTLEPVQKARVHIARPERSLFKDDEQPPTASVTVALKAGRRLSQAQVRGIVHVVAASVEGLLPERVTLIDDSGTVMWAGGDEGAGVEGHQELERTLARRVGAMVERVVGVGHAEVVVTAEVDYARTERTEELFDKDRIALRSEQKSDEKSTAPSLAAGGVAGAQGNLPGAPAPSATVGSAGASAQKTNETRNYEINRIVNHTVGPKAKVKKLHVAVLVDYAQKPDAPGQRIARSADELKRIEEIAREAAGIDSERGDHLQVSSAPFIVSATADDSIHPPVGPLSNPLVWVAMAAPAVLLVMVLALVLRRRRRHGQGAMPMLPATVGELERNLPGVTQAQLRPATVRDRVAEIARQDASRAAEVLSAWLAEPNPGDTTEAKGP